MTTHFWQPLELESELFGTCMGRRNRDTTGPITRTVSDAAQLLEAMVGYDPADNLTSLFLQVRLSKLATRSEGCHGKHIFL